MNKEEKHISDFLAGKLHGEDLLKFKAKLRNDEGLLDKVSKKAVAVYGREKMRGKLESIHQEIAQEKKTIRFYWIAAAMVIALGIPLLLGILNSSNRNQELFAQHFSVAHHIPTMEHDENHPFHKGFLSYANGNYEKAIEHFNSKEEKHDQVHYYLGISHLAKENPDAKLALSHFDSIKEFSFLTKDVQWYRSLCLILLDSIDEAKGELKKLIDKDHEKKDDAKELLEDLE